MRKKMEGGDKNLNKVKHNFLILGSLQIGIKTTLDGDEDRIQFFMIDFLGLSFLAMVLKIIQKSIVTPHLNQLYCIMEQLIRKVTFLINILTTNKQHVFKLIDNRLPISKKMSVFLDRFCLHLICFIGDIEECIRKMTNMHLKDWSLIEVLEMMKQKEERDVKEWSVRAQILQNAHFRDLHSHKIPQLFQSLDDSLEYYHKLLTSLHELNRSVEKKQADQTYRSLQYGRNREQVFKYETPKKKDKSIQKYASLYDKSKDTSSTARTAGKIRTHNPHSKQSESLSSYKSVNPKFTNPQSESEKREKERTYRRQLSKQMHKDLYKGNRKQQNILQPFVIQTNNHETSKKKIQTKKYQYLFEEDDQAPQYDTPSSQTAGKNPSVYQPFNYYKEYEGKEKQIMKNYQQNQHQTPKNHASSLGTVSPYDLKRTAADDHNQNQIHLLKQFEKNFFTEADSLQLFAKHHNNDSLERELSFEVNQSVASYDLQKILCQSLLSSKRWDQDQIKGRESVQVGSDSETDSLDELNRRQTGKFKFSNEEEQQGQERLPIRYLKQFQNQRKSKEINNFSFGS